MVVMPSYYLLNACKSDTFLFKYLDDRNSMLFYVQPIKFKFQAYHNLKEFLLHATALQGQPTIQPDETIDSKPFQSYFAPLIYSIQSSILPREFLRNRCT
jgi:hypothetical protein